MKSYVKPHLFVFGAFALTVLATMTNVACSGPAEIDSGTTESRFTNGYGYGSGYGYAAEDVAADRAGGN